MSDPDNTDPGPIVSRLFNKHETLEDFAEEIERLMLEEQNDPTRTKPWTVRSRTETADRTITILEDPNDPNITMRIERMEL
ncbi:hypothetical protein [Achromobacter phage Motura]|uniref:Uncharacterized protein n=1 Tax=Achromobacter phage Motura TaxID=2591403 RepID=A0A514CSG9_9CAUD|nr:hypothetical protein H1O15_gp004 [Achromobacter phage Motura]QDH83413.1 hypothetical protein [Achromobacter phage Motura]